MINVRGIYDNSGPYKSATWMRVGMNLLLFNPGEFDMKIPGEIRSGTRKHLRVHIFVTSTACADETLVPFVQEWYKQDTHPMKLVIHIPRKVKDLYKLIDDRFKDNGVWDLDSRISMYVESKGPTFECYHHHTLNSIYDEDGVRVMIEYRRFINDAPFAEYQCSIKHNTGGPFDSEPKVISPELFKDELLKKFKEACPPGILDTFKDDNDIWNYMMANGEWRVEGESNTDANT